MKSAPTYRTEFPDFAPETMPTIPAGFVDSSWRNDACPHFLTAPEGKGLSLWIDYDDQNVREFRQDGRFFLTTWDDGVEGERPLYVGDDWNAVLAAIAAYNAKA